MAGAYLRELAARARRRKKRFAIVLTAWAALAAVLVLPMPQIFIKNTTASMPLGYYLILPKAALRVGDTVSFSPPKKALDLALERGWISEPVNFLKTVGALPGDTYTITDRAIFVNGTYIGPVYDADSQGRPMPKLRGTYVVADGYFLPLSTYRPHSFDGRYFGQTSLPDVRCKVCPFFTSSIWEVFF